MGIMMIVVTEGDGCLVDVVEGHCRVLVTETEYGIHNLLTHIHHMTSLLYIHKVAIMYFKMMIFLQ